MPSIDIPGAREIRAANAEHEELARLKRELCRIVRGGLPPAGYRLIAELDYGGSGGVWIISRSLGDIETPMVRLDPEAMTSVEAFELATTVCELFNLAREMEEGK